MTTSPPTVPHSAVTGSRRWLLPIPLLAAAALSACGGTTSADGGSSETSPDDVSNLEETTIDASSDEVASLEETTDDADSTDAGSTLDADEAALEFSACLREQGLEVPDIGVDADGNIQLRDAFAEIDRTDELFQTAMGTCQGIIADVGFGGGGGGPGAAIRDNVEVQDALVELVDCMRDEGHTDATQLELGQPGGQGADGEGGGPPQAGQGGQAGQGQGQGPGQGGRATRLITQMGLDPEDPAVVESMEVCMPIIDEAFAAAGVGPQGSN
ncbi:MAG: hypothetical protein AAGD33_21915 [Actinomycetota bacterium]